MAHADVRHGWSSPEPMVSPLARAHRHGQQARWLPWLLLFLLLTVPWKPARAHGGGAPQLVNQPAGPYWISVWSAPDPARVGELHLTVAVTEPGEGREAGAPILGAEVMITMTLAAGDKQPVTARATSEQAANRLFYEADLVVPAADAWTVQIDVSGPRGEGDASFLLDVSEARSTNWTLIGGAAALAVALGFVVRSVRRTDEA